MRASGLRYGSVHACGYLKTAGFVLLQLCPALGPHSPHSTSGHTHFCLQSPWFPIIHRNNIQNSSNSHSVRAAASGHCAASEGLPPFSLSHLILEDPPNHLLFYVKELCSDFCCREPLPHTHPGQRRRGRAYFLA